ncbi:Phosphatidylinositol N-acetylglucosaminyltransferase GPI3 subunit [Hypoxylon texense]
MVIGQLMWKPFNVRFSDLVEKLENRHKVLFDELAVTNLTGLSDERANAEASRKDMSEEQKRNQEEREAAAKEREMAQRERMLADAERRNNLEERKQTSSKLDKLLGKQKFTEDEYRGKPGAGKTVLAASIIEYLEGSYSRNDMLYFFFQSQSPENTASDAYRSILAQLLQKSGRDLDLLYRFSFAFPKPDIEQGNSDVSGLSSDGQRKFTSTIIFELLRLCLRRGSVLVLDGVDECRDLDIFISSLRRLLEAHPHTRVILLSRINIARLKHMVQDQYHLEFPEISISTDIGQFLTAEISELFEEGMLPGSVENTDALVRKLVRGADGMFLWARLMINLLRSPSMTPYQRLEVIERVTVPEGLEKLYERIFLYIASTGLRALNLASSCLAWLTKVAPPMSSSQLREALIIQGHLSNSATRDDIVEFEEAIIMTCAGLVIRAPVGHSQSTTFLTLVHISIKEMVEELIINRTWIDQYLNHGLHCIITDCSAARLDLANCCLRKILNPDCAEFSERGNQGIELAQDFSAYASVYWLCYVQDAICKCQPITDMHPHVKLAALGALSKLLGLLSELFEKPKTLSRWLYDFYSTYSNRLSSRAHPPSTVLSSLANWITRAWANDIVPNDKLLHTLGIFDEELGSIITTWGNDLKTRPHIIWDEMTSFTNSKLFFNLGTTRVTYQFPQIPAARNSQQKLVTLISKTSQTGTMKGVLSIWTPLYVTAGMI